MKAVTVIVTNEMAKHLERLIETGHITAHGGVSYSAYCLALSSRPTNGERWIKVEEIDSGDWARLPKKLVYGG